MQKPLQRLPGLHASTNCGQPERRPDPGAAKAAGSLQQPADRHVWNHRQVCSSTFAKIHFCCFAVTSHATVP